MMRDEDAAKAYRPAVIMLIDEAQKRVGHSPDPDSPVMQQLIALFDAIRPLLEV